MIQLQDVALSFGGQRVLDGLTWTITNERHRIGLIGPNGAGKTTLLRVIAGTQPVDDGRVDTGSTTVGYLEQDVQELPADTTVRQAALQAFGDVLALEDEEAAITHQLDVATDYESDAYAKLLDRLAAVQERLTAAEAHLIRPRADATLTGLGFDPDALDRPLRTFSGGWRMRVALARLLLQRPDVLLLDEPTNHLDIDSIDWLESYLKGYPGTVVLVSHDRYFLDRMVTSIAELAHGQVNHYAGNYAFYLDARQERRQLQQQAYDNQQRRIKEIERFIERFRYKATKASQVQSRIKQLDKMDRLVPPPSEEATVSFRFPEPPRAGQVVLELSRFSKTYAGREGTVEVFRDADPLTITRGAKIALVGPNGAGKSTLARIIGGTEPFDGQREEGYRVATSFFAQHQADTLDPRRTILEALREAARGQGDTTLRTLAGAFLFTGDDVFKKIGVLSGGERSRVALARTLLSPANLLILDEPTNHLDIQSKNVLIEALQQYAGTFVIVSHDRHFLDGVAEQTWRVGGGRVDTFDGTYSAYRWHVEHGTRRAHGDGAPNATDATPTATTAAATPGGDGTSGTSGASTNGASGNGASTNGASGDGASSDGKADDRFAHLNSYQLRQKLDAVEASILDKETRQEELEAEMADPALYDDPETLRATTAAYESVQTELAALYDTWEALTEHVA